MRKRSFDWYTLIPVLLLLCIGIIMVLSASSAKTAASVLKVEGADMSKAADPFYYFNKQFISVLIGLAGMFFMSTIDYRKWKQCIKPAMYLSIGLLMAVFMFEKRNGAHSWILFGERGFQPSEFVKLCLILILAYIINVKKEKIKSFEQGVLPALVVIGLIVGLVILQPDFGTGLVMLSTSFLMLFAGGVSGRHLKSLMATGIVVVTLAVVNDMSSKSYRFLR
ncbi:MAG TPA: FtsW/RodA/SpoVE family cell cycle protein, partial [Desulfobacteria bacterium]|nr:FtsW/RodA/SpoVE family cell cycle protein [Desulfobacteria bacterium]